MCSSDLNTGTLTINGDIVAIGTFDQSGGGSTALAANISTTDSNITFANAVALGASSTVTIDSGSGGGDVTFSGAITGASAGAETLTITAGTGLASLAAVGANGTELGATPGTGACRTRN